MRIAITGSRGSVGNAIMELALAQGHSVVSIDRTPVGADASMPNVTAMQADITKYSELENAFRDCDAVVHMAAFPAPGIASVYDTHNNNVTGSYNALCAAVALGIKKVCQASSINAIGAAYSRAPRFDYFPVDEKHPTYNEDPYSLSKWICEAQGDSIARRNEDMTISSMRFHWVVSERGYAANHKRELWNEFSRNLWGYTRFDAAAQACLLSLTADFKGHEAFFIVAPDTMMDLPSTELAERFFPDVPIRGDLSGTKGFFDCSKAERLLGWKHQPGK